MIASLEDVTMEPNVVSWAVRAATFASRSRVRLTFSYTIITWRTVTTISSRMPVTSKKESSVIDEVRRAR